MSDHDTESADRSARTRPPVSSGWLFALSMTAALATGAWLILSEAPGDAHGYSTFMTTSQAEHQRP